MGYKGKGRGFSWIFVFRRYYVDSGVILGGFPDFYAELIANRPAVRRLPGEVRNGRLAELIGKDYFLELIYAALTSWDMNARGAKMKYFDDFKTSIVENRKYFEELEKYKLDELNKKEFSLVRRRLAEVYDNLSLMKSKKRLVSNSKVMHFLLPDLVMPMDGRNTLKFFFGNSPESREKFLSIIECSYRIARETDLSGLRDDKWNLSIPKIIDNAIICDQSPKYGKKR